MDNIQKRQIILASIRRRVYRKLPNIEDVLYISLSLVLGFGIGVGSIGQGFSTYDYFKKVRAQGVSTQPPTPSPSPTPFFTPDKPMREDMRIMRLYTYLKDHESPLADYADLIVSEADKYDIGWTKLVSISGMESEYGRRAPNGSYNAWGVGGKKLFRFGSWDDSIKYTSQLLSKNYKLSEIKAVQAKYCPVKECNPTWATTVHSMSNAILAVGSPDN